MWVTKQVFWVTTFQLFIRTMFFETVMRHSPHHLSVDKWDCGLWSPWKPLHILQSLRTLHLDCPNLLLGLLEQQFTFAKHTKMKERHKATGPASSGLSRLNSSNILLDTSWQAWALRDQEQPSGWISTLLQKIRGSLRGVSPVSEPPKKWEW